MESTDEKFKKEVENYNTTDADLVELSGHHAYKNYEMEILKKESMGKNFM